MREEKIDEITRLLQHCGPGELEAIQEMLLCMAEGNTDTINRILRFLSALFRR